MTDKLFSKLWTDAIEQPNMELFIGEYGYPDWFDEISTDVGEVISVLESIHTAAHMPFCEILKKSGMKMTDFSLHYLIPYRTVQNWVDGSRACTDYIRLFLIRDLGIVKGI